MPHKGDRNPQTTIDLLRDYVKVRYSSDFGVSDDVLDAYLTRARAWKEAGGDGGELWKAAEELKHAYMPEMG